VLRKRFLVLLALPLAALAVVVAVSTRASVPPAQDRHQTDRAEPRSDASPRHPAARRSAAGKGYQFPNRETTGVPEAWEPRETRASDLTITQPGAVVEDIRFTNGANIIVEARDVTIRRVELQGGLITNQWGSGCGTGLLVEDSTFEPAEGQPYVGSDLPVLAEGDYTARRVEIWKRGEGFRASDCGPVTVTDSFAYIEGDTPDCGRDLHSDGVQGYYAKGMTLRNATIVFGNDCGTSPYYIGYGRGYPSEPPINTGTYTVDRLLVAGGGYVFRQGVPGSVTGLRIVDDSWVYGPIDSACSDISPWEAKIVTVDAGYRITGVVRNQRCDTETRD
jgi:hypothetical protein